MTGPKVLDLPDRDRWSIAVGARVSTKAERVIVIPPMADPYFGGYADDLTRAVRAWEVAFERAKRDVARAPVRIIGRGVTVRTNWPAWVERANDLTLTEFDAYLPKERLPYSRELVQAARAWLDELFEGTLPSMSPADAMWGSAVHRLLIPAFWTWPAVSALLHYHARDSVFCTDATWMGALALRRGVEKAGGAFEAPPERTLVLFRLRAAAVGAATAIGSVALRAVEFVRERPARARVSELRANGQTDAASIWIGVIGDRPHASRHVVEGVLKAAASRGKRVGVLLQGSLKPGNREAEGAPSMFPTLDHPLLDGRIAALDQCTSVESVVDLGRIFVDFLRHSPRVISRVVRMGDTLELGPLPIRLTWRIAPVLRLATLDRLRAAEARAATRSFLERARPQTRTPIVWAHASFAGHAVPDLVTRSDGYTTYDLAHGAIFEPVMVMHERTNSSVKVLWSVSETRYLSEYFKHHERTIGGFMPRLVPSRRPAPTWTAARPLRVLALTSYLIDGRTNGALPLEGYQYAFFDTLAQAKTLYGRPLEIRWRPHPWDNREYVTRHLVERKGLVDSVSLERGVLQQDLDWTDIVLTSLSSTITEALCHPVPVLLHDVPLNDTSVCALFDKTRRFSDGVELANALRHCADSLAPLGPSALLPEKDLRHRLFGPSGEPRDLADVWWPNVDRFDRVCDTGITTNTRGSA